MDKLNESPEYQIAKYKELYNLATIVFAEELSRSANIERKAASYISILTFLIGVFGFFSRQVFSVLIPPVGVLSWTILIVLIIFIGVMVFAWFTLFRILRLYHYSKLPIPVDFFHENKLATVYYGMAKGIRQNLKINRHHGDKKGELLDRSYDLMRLMVVMLLIICFLFGTHAWLNVSAKTSKHSERRIQMTEDTSTTTPVSQDQTPQAAPQQGAGQSPQQAETSPDIDVTPPSFDIQTNAAEPPQIGSILTETKDD